MSDISCRIFEFFENGTTLYDYSITDLADVSGTDLETLQNPANRVPWRVWAAISERFEQLIGGEEETIIAGGRIIDMQFAEPARIMGRALVAPDLVYTAIVRWLAPVYFRGLEWNIEQLAPGHLVIQIEVPDPVSPAWFRMASGAFTRVPTAFNCDPAQITTTIEGNRGRFEVRCESRTTLWARTAARWRAAMSAPALLDEMIDMQRDLRNALGDATNSQRELRLALSAVPDPVAVLVNGRATWRNEAWKSSLGKSVPEEVLRALKANNAANTQEVKAASNLSLQVVPPVKIMHEGEAALLVLLRDVTRTQEAAERMRVADRLASLGTLAASVGHEINNPLQVAMGSLQLANSQLSGQIDPTTLHQLEAAIEAITRAATITSDLLAIGREDLVDDAVDMGLVIDTALRLTGNELRHIGSIEKNVPDELPLVTGSSSSLIQVMVNLLVNAAHAMHEQPDREHSITISASVGDAQVRVVIEDTGPGIPPEILLRIREPFFTTKGNDGSGLGLAICERILNDHGGRLEITNRPDVGARFEIQLPATEAQAVTAKPKQSPTDNSSKFLRVLVVDDEESIASLLSLLLEPHSTVVCHSGPEALAAIAENPAFDVILLDIMLKEQNGVALHAQLPESLRERVVFMTGGVFRQELQEALALLSNPILAKPFTRESVFDALATISGKD